MKKVYFKLNDEMYLKVEVLDDSKSFKIPKIPVNFAEKLSYCAIDRGTMLWSYKKEKTNSGILYSRIPLKGEIWIYNGGERAYECI